MEKILVSACLLGDNCTYKGTNNLQPYLQQLNQFYDIIPFCPEVEGGLPTPRKPSEIRGSFVYHDDGTEVTAQFREGAFKAVQIASYFNVRLAILKERSPSCGVHQIHDGTFSNRLIPGEGITAAALRHNGVEVLNEEEGLALLQKLLEENAKKDALTENAKKQENQPKKPQEEHQPRQEERRPKKPIPGKPGYSYQGKTRPFAGKDNKRGSRGKPRYDKKGGKPGGED
ncbi:MAG: DUF523 domain-containing protein [Bacilli bacterium]|nr:DUF523 domain-containing protein [Bacilli bacterium]